MLNYSHKHDFNLEVSTSGKDECSVCGNEVGRSQEAYSCSGCGIWMDESCAKLQPEIHRTFRRRHPLNLLPKNVSDNCSLYLYAARGTTQTEASYYCSNCDFSLGFRCASLQSPKTTTTSPIIQPIINSIHPHPLIPCSSSSPDGFHCSYCWLRLEGTFLVCIRCHLFLHQSCFEFPFKISHSHPIDQHHHPFTFQRDSGNICNFCDQHIRNGFSFQCRKCDLYLDFHCGSLKPTEISHDLELRIQDFNHPHPFTAFENPMNFLFFCRLCELPIMKETIFACFECKLIMHISCALLPREIKHHPFHPLHPIKLDDNATQRSFRKSCCWLCGTFKLGGREFRYLCPDCNFSIHSSCAFPVPSVLKIQIHDHPLALLTPEESVVVYCHSCGRSCESAFFMCVRCKSFALHVACIPNLPPIAKDVHHRHPLRLTFSRIKDHAGEDGRAEFYCDSCEERRELPHPTYYCAECHYVAHIHCLASEVTRLLQEEEQEEDVASMEEANQKETTQNEGDISPPDDVETEIRKLRLEVNELQAKLAALQKRHDKLLKATQHPAQKKTTGLKPDHPILLLEQEILRAQLELVADKLAAFPVAKFGFLYKTFRS